MPWIDSELAAFPWQRNKTGTAGENHFFGADNIDLECVHINLSATQGNVHYLSSGTALRRTH
jgi:hypothetical protein